MLSCYWVEGAYDLIVTTEVPDDYSGSAAALTVASSGNVSTETLRAFTQSEMEQIIQKMA